MLLLTPSAPPQAFPNQTFPNQAGPLFATADAAAGGKQAPHSGYDQRAVAVLEEAMALGAVPLVKLDGEATIDMRALPPNVAEVYVLAVMGQMQRRRDPRRETHLLGQGLGDRGQKPREPEP